MKMIKIRKENHTVKKIAVCALSMSLCAGLYGTAWASGVTEPFANATVATTEISGSASGTESPFSMTGKVGAVDIISVVMPADITFYIECDKNNGKINKIQSGVGEFKNNSNRNMDLTVLNVVDDSNSPGQGKEKFLDVVNLYMAESGKSLEEVKKIPGAQLVEGASYTKPITTLQRVGSQAISLYGEAVSQNSRLKKTDYSIQITMKVSIAP